MIYVLLDDEALYHSAGSILEDYVSGHPFAVVRGNDKLRLEMVPEAPKKPFQMIRSHFITTGCHLVFEDGRGPSDPTDGIRFQRLTRSEIVWIWDVPYTQYTLAECFDPVLLGYFWNLLSNVADQLPDVMARMVEVDDDRIVLGGKLPLTQLATTEVANVLHAEELQTGEMSEMIPLPSVQPRQPEMRLSLLEVLAAAGIGPDNWLDNWRERWLRSMRSISAKMLTGDLAFRPPTKKENRRQVNSPAVVRGGYENVAAWLGIELEQSTSGQGRKLFVVPHQDATGWKDEWEDPNLLPPNGLVILTKVRVIRMPQRITLEVHGKHLFWRKNKERPSPQIPIDYPLFTFDLVAASDSKTLVYSRLGYEHWPNMKRYQAEVLGRIEQQFGEANTDRSGQASESAQVEPSDEIVPQPWEVIPDIGWKRQALELWHAGYTSREIAEKIGVPTAKTVLNAICILRGIYGTDVVPERRSKKKSKTGTKPG